MNKTRVRRKRGEERAASCEGNEQVSSRSNEEERVER